MTVAYIDAHREAFGVEPICAVSWVATESWSTVESNASPHAAFHAMSRDSAAAA